MVERTSESLAYHHSTPWPLRKVIPVVTLVCLGIWGLALTALLG